MRKSKTEKQVDAILGVVASVDYLVGTGMVESTTANRALDALAADIESAMERANPDAVTILDALKVTMPHDLAYLPDRNDPGRQGGPWMGQWHDKWGAGK